MKNNCALPKRATVLLEHATKIKEIYPKRSCYVFQTKVGSATGARYWFPSHLNFLLNTETLFWRKLNKSDLSYIISSSSIYETILHIVQMKWICSHWYKTFQWGYNKIQRVDSINLWWNKMTRPTPYDEIKLINKQMLEFEMKYPMVLELFLKCYSFKFIIDCSSYANYILIVQYCITAIL